MYACVWLFLHSGQELGRVGGDYVEEEKGGRI